MIDHNEQDCIWTGVRYGFVIGQIRTIGEFTPGDVVEDIYTKQRYVVGDTDHKGTSLSLARTVVAKSITTSSAHLACMNPRHTTLSLSSASTRPPIVATCWLHQPNPLRNPRRLTLEGLFA